MIIFSIPTQVEVELRLTTKGFLCYLTKEPYQIYFDKMFLNDRRFFCLWLKCLLSLRHITLTLKMLIFNTGLMLHLFMPLLWYLYCCYSFIYFSKAIQNTKYFHQMNYLCSAPCFQGGFLVYSILCLLVFIIVVIHE